MAVTAVALCGTFVSCHDDEITTTTIEQRKLAFEEAFVSFFGQPDPNHTWGFGNAGENVTRSVNVNGNEWETRPEVTAEEAAAVYAWVNRPKSEIPTKSYYEDSPVNLKNFFVTQVWGKNDNSDDPNAKYKDYDNGDVFGGEKMNHLQISKSADRLGIDGVASANNGEGAINANWDHANNFNASQNRDWDGNTMFVNWGTQNFAYHNSTDSKYHDKWIIVDGAYITDSKGINHAGKYYVCFDFIARNPNAYTNFQEPGVGGVTVPGAWKTVEDAVNAGAIASNGHPVASNWSKGNIVGGNMVVDANEYYTDWIVRLVEAKPINTPQELTLPKIMIPGSTGKTLREVYTETRAVEGGRVMCEDIASQSYQRKDFDYNDVVFDAIIYKKSNVLVTTTYDSNNNETNKFTTIDYTQVDDMPDPSYAEYYANIRVMAAGGTIPLQITANGNNFEVHNVLGKKPTSVMINTLPEGEQYVVNMATIDHHDPVDLKVDGSTDIEGVEHINDIAIDVKYSQASARIDAIPGRASAKILVPLGTRWAKERTDISEAYPGFSSWVNSESGSGNIWIANNINTSVMYEDEKMVGLSMPENNPISSSRIWYKEESNGTALTPTDATNTTLVRPGSNETILYDYTSGKGPGFLYESGNANDGVVKVLTTDEGFSSITQGSTIRIYGVSIDNWEVLSSFNPSSAITSYAGDGYVEIQVTNPSLIANTGLLVTGKNFTVTFITVINASSDNGGDDNNNNGGDDNNNNGGDDNNNNGGDDNNNNGGDDNNNNGGDNTNSYAGTLLLENPAVNQQNNIPASVFENANVKAGDQIRIYYSWLQDYYWQIYTLEGLNSGYQYTIQAWNGTGINTQSRFVNSTENYIFMDIDSDLATMLRARGIIMVLDGMTATYITLVQQ